MLLLQNLLIILPLVHKYGTTDPPSVGFKKKMFLIIWTVLVMDVITTKVVLVLSNRNLPPGVSGWLSG